MINLKMDSIVTVVARRNYYSYGRKHTDLGQVSQKIRIKQAGAELCQAQHSLSLDLVTNWLGLITQLWLELEA